MSAYRTTLLLLLTAFLLPLSVAVSQGQNVNPTIVINNDTGTNPPAASGAPGSIAPEIPLSGCETSGASTTIQSPAHGLSVPVDGSAAVWMETASGRRWSKITGIPNGDTFTVQNSFNIAAPVDCVVGGEIAGTLGNLTRLCQDLMTGWTVVVENTGTPYVDSGACQVGASSQALANNGRIVIRGDDSSNPTPILYQTNATNYFQQSSTVQLKIENLQLIKDTSGGTSGTITNIATLVKNTTVSNNQGSWASAWGNTGNSPSVVISSRFQGPFTTNCNSLDDSDLVIANFLDGCSGSSSAIMTSTPPVAILFNIIDQQGSSQAAFNGSVNNGFGGRLLYNTMLNVGGSGVILGLGGTVSGNLIGEASTLGGACWEAGAGNSNWTGGSGEIHTIWRGNAANLCPTARYAGGLESTSEGAATDINMGNLVNPQFVDEGNLNFFPNNTAVKSNLVFPGSLFPLLTPAEPVSTTTAGAAQRPGGGGVTAYAY